MTCTVVVTRPRNPYEASPLVDEDVRSLGATPVVLQVVHLQKVSLHKEQEAHLLQIVAGTASWVFFLSPNGVFFTREQIADRGVRQVSPHTRIAVQGPGTADAVRVCFARAPDFFPTVSHAEGLVDEFLTAIARPLHENLVIVPQSASGRDVVGPSLSKGGYQVAAVNVYDTLLVSPDKRVLEHVSGISPSDIRFLFMSPSAVKGVVLAFSNTVVSFSRYAAVCIGPVTADAARGAGFGFITEAPTHDRPGVIAALKASIETPHF